MVNPNSADDYQRTQANASALLSDVFFFYNEDIEAAMTDPNMAGHALSGIINSDKGAIEVQRLSGKWQVSDVLKEKGWAGAGIWYNKIAEMNGAVTSAVLNLPRVSKFPVVMEEVYARKVQYDQNIDPSSRYEPGTLGNGKPMVLSSWPQADVKAKAMWEAYSYLLDISSSPKTKPTGNVFLDTISTLFGTEGLFSMRKNEDVHPLAQLVGIGRSLIDSSINNLGYAASIAATGALTGTFSNLLGATADVMVGFITSIAFFMITIGFILYYILPFIPFIYFFFAVGGWIKGIFEALVGAPLWALAHIRIDGDGLPGKAALNGYYLILEIFLRPILTVFGLIASVSIFAALVAMLNDIWDLAVSNLGGFDMKAEISDPANANPQNNGNNLEFFRSAIDQLFYTIVYAVIVYMMAMSSFKLIDLIPNNITRWLGQSVSAFNDSRENPSDQMINTSYIGGDQITSSVEGPTSNMLSKITTSTSKQSGG
jgi:conjugal transfer/type IV secretion protein DotA/TraY